MAGHRLPLAERQALAGDSAVPEVSSRPEGKPSRFRGDVAGLRAVAVVLVVLYHAGLPGLPGGFVGVDVFFVISGFLITGQLIDEIDRSGRVSLAGFYARRAKRILPAAAVVLVVVAAASRLLLPRIRWQEIGGDTVGAATYIINWRLAGRSVDYLREDVPPSPLQHYWSLAVEEQFYLVWPLLIILALLAARLIRRTALRPILGVALVAVAVPSFLWSIAYTAESPSRAFFVSTTRMWELSLGAALALLAIPVTRLPRGLAVPLGWLGLAAIVASGLLVTTDTAWPGYAAALPTLGAVAVIAAGAAAGRWGPVALLGTRPFRWTGDLSYSLYLWHWPMLVIATGHWGGLSHTMTLAVAVASVIPAWLTYKLVENPIRYSRAVSRSPRLSLSLGGNLSLVGICAGLALALLGALAASGARPTAAAPPAPGAAVLPANPAQSLGDHMPEYGYIIPDPLHADVPDSSGVCFQMIDASDANWCEYGNPDAKTEVALVGDSKMDQWLPAFQALAEQNDWKVVIAGKASCPFTSARTVRPVSGGGNQPYPSCDTWNTRVLARLKADRPAYVFTSQALSLALDASGKLTEAAMIKGVQASWREVGAVGSRVIVLANNPDPGLNVDQCVDQHRHELLACTFDRIAHDEDPAYLMQRKAVKDVPDVTMIDLFDFICPTLRCPPVIGYVLVYRSSSHLTASYVKTLTPRLATALARIGVPVEYTAT
jgi:peptidoglycan/LPS O-acetylase OafA/YrhL